MGFTTAPVASRGRPREERVDVAIAEALRALLEEVGYGRLTMEAVAAQAGVGKATLYRRYHSKAEMVFANAVHGSVLHAPDTGSLRGDLAVLGRRIVADLGPPSAATTIPGLLADLARDPALRARFHQVFIAGERAVIAQVLDRACARRELTDGADPDMVHALVLGTIFAWLFLLDLPPDDLVGERVATLAADALERPRP